MSDDINRMLDAINDKNYTTANDVLNDLLSDKLRQSLEQEKVGVASNMFREEEQDEDYIEEEDEGEVDETF